jgi:glycosyltransferase involved in cell wall biosynthesis
MAADRLLFNSDFNRRTFLRGVEALMRRLPDKTPPTLLPGLLEKSQVLPVPVDVGDPSRIEAHWPGAVSRVGPDILRIAWVGRFEHDKGGEGLLRILHGLEKARLDYEIAVTGRQFRKSPDAFKTVGEAFAHRLVQLGFLPERHEYLALLRGADVVLSTADHEFQGLAVMEAVALGCVPILPDRQVYPEWYPEEYLYLSAPQDPDREAAEAVEHIIRVAQASTVPAPPDMSGLLPGVLREQYAHCFNCLAAGSA